MSTLCQSSGLRQLKNLSRLTNLTLREQRALRASKALLCDCFCKGPRDGGGPLAPEFPISKTLQLQLRSALKDIVNRPEVSLAEKRAVRRVNCELCPATEARPQVGPGPGPGPG